LDYIKGLFFGVYFLDSPLSIKITGENGLVDKYDCSAPKNIGEIGFRRQNWPFPSSKWWRKPISSPKLTISHPKLVTRANLVVKIGRFPTQNGDENQSRRQNWPFLTPNWWREPISSPKLAVSHL